MKHRVRTAAAAGGLAVCVATLAIGAPTNTYYVNVDNGTPSAPYKTWGDAATTIQAAVQQADTDWNADTNFVVLVTNGLYDLTGQIELFKPITLRSVNGRDYTTINGGYPAYSNRCCYITNDASLIGFTITNGYAIGLAPTNWGAGVFIDGGNARIEDCTIMYNKAVAGYGGGIALSGGSNLVKNCVVACNETTGGTGGRGTGMYILNSSGFVRDCVVSNHVQDSNNGTGAGLYMYLSSDCVVSNSQFNGNECSRFGGNYVFGGTVTHCVFSNNYARSAAGGFYLYGSYTGSKLLNSTVVWNRVGSGSGGGVGINRGILENCVITHNYASASGGGVHSGSGQIKNCLIAANYAPGNGGGINRTSVAQQIQNCTVVRNKANGLGGGIYTVVTNRPDNFLNLIVTGNESGGGAQDIDSSVSNWYENISYSCSPDLDQYVNSNIPDDPNFIANGSGAGTNAVLGNYSLNYYSPCEDEGTNQTWMTTGGPTIDLAGDPRILPLLGTVNMGAYEYVPPPPSEGTLILLN